MPVDAELREYYRSYSLSENRPEQLPFLDAQARARLAFCSDLLPRHGGLRVLDIGAGYGCIATHLAALAPGLSYDAIEWDRDSVEYLRSNPAVGRVLSKLARRMPEYDLVILAHVLEHVPQPVGYLRSLRRYLQPGSLVFVEVPNEDWRYKDSNEPHLVFFSPPTIHMLLESAGFRVLRSGTFGVPTSELEGFWGSLNVRKEEIRRADKADSEKGKLMLQEFLDERKRQRERMREFVESAGTDRQWIRLVAAMV